MNNGWIKNYRKSLENPIITKDGDHFAVWNYLLLSATHTEIDKLFKGKRITLKPGQLLTGRKSIAKFFHISESKVQRILTLLENEQQIEQQTSSQNRLVTIINWDKYQGSEQQIEQRVDNEWTTSEQRVNTNKNIKNIKNDKKVEKKAIANLSENTLAINELVKYFQLKIGGTLDRDVKTNRQFCYNLLRKMKKDYPTEQPIILIEQLIDAAINDKFHSKNATNFEYLYRHTRAIIETLKPTNHKTILSI